MRFNQAFMDEIKSRLPLSDLVGRRVKLKKQGREWRGLSPFNNEKTPSFYVNDQKEFFHCFSSSKHGDHFGFIMETEGVSFPEAVERLADMVGIALPIESPEMREVQEKRTTLYDVMELSSKFFEEQLQARIGAKARGYLQTRGLSAATQLKFRLGYSPNERFALRDYLSSKGVSKLDMIAAGMLIHGDDIPVPYDRFRDRLMFPIHDLRGKIIAFGGRALEKDVPAKYLNSPDTELFHKGNQLYHGHVARVAAHKTERLIAVEGYMDVIALATNGLEEVVAPLGTALTEEQLSMLWKMADEPILLFDGDKAGERAAYRAAELALRHLKPMKTLRFATIPNGQDPDDFIRFEGRKGMDGVLDAAIPLVEKIWQREISSGLFDTPERKAALEASLKQVANSIQDDSLKRHYRDDLLRRFNEYFPSRPSFIKGKSPLKSLKVAHTQNTAQSVIVKGFSQMQPREGLLLVALINHPFLFERQFDEISHLEMRENSGQVLLQMLLDRAAGFDNEEVNIATTAFKSTFRLPIPVSLGEKAQENDVLTIFHQLLTLHNKSFTLHKELMQAEIDLAEDFSEENFERLKDIKLRMHNVEGLEALVEGFGKNENFL